MENRSHALVAGLFALLLGCAAALALWWFGGKHESVKEYLVVTRQNVTGLSLQGQVRYRGIRVGKVQAIDLDPQDPGNILIRIAVDSAVPVTRGTTAKLNYQGVTGIAHILLEEGGSDSTPLPGSDPSTALLGGGGEPPRIAMSPSLIQELSDNGGATLRQARELLTNANEIFDDENRERFANILANVETTTGSASAAAAQLRQLLTPATVRSVNTSLARAEQVAGEAAPLLVEIRQLTARLRMVSDRLDTLLADPSPNGAGALVPRLNTLGSDLSANSRQLGRVLQMLEDSPQSLVFGPPAPAPGPGEAGFIDPPNREGTP